MQNKLLLLFSLLFIINFQIFSQSIARSVISSGGKYSTTASARLYANVGEIAVSTGIVPNYRFTEGFVQPPFLTSVGITEINNPAFSLYPNPATDIITITNSSKIISIELMDIQGRRVSYYEHIPKSIINQFAMDVKNLESGIYFIKIISEENTKPIVCRVVKM